MDYDVNHYQAIIPSVECNTREKIKSLLSTYCIFFAGPHTSVAFTCTYVFFLFLNVDRDLQSGQKMLFSKGKNIKKCRGGPNSSEKLLNMDII